MPPTRKHSGAVALGRRGGRANTSAQQAARAANARLGGRPTRYRLADGTLQRRDDAGHWHALTPPYDPAARAYLRRHAQLRISHQ